MSNSSAILCDFSVCIVDDIFSALAAQCTYPRTSGNPLESAAPTTSYASIAAVLEEMLGEDEAFSVLAELTAPRPTDDSQACAKALHRIARASLVPPPEPDSRTKIILVDTDLERRIATGYSLEALGYRVFAAATIETILRYPHLYDACTHLAHGEGCPDEVILDLWARDFENTLTPISLDFPA